MEKTTAYVMCGIPGAGKSTYANKLAETEDAMIISGDQIKNELYGSPDVAGDWDTIWSRIDQYISDYAPRTVILDGTHHRSDYRAEALMLLRSYGYENIELVVMDVSLATALARNFQRPYSVPDYVVKQMHEELQRSLKTVMSEPFSRFNFVY